MTAAPELDIRQLDEYITVFDIPFSRFGILPIGNRSTAVKLKDSRVLVVVSSPCDEPTKAKLAELGQVSYLIAPDLEHTMRISDFHRTYPEAKCIGPAGVTEKKPDIKWEGVMGEGGESKVYGFEDEIKLQFLPGHVNKELAVLHIPSRTLIQADLIFNLPCTEQYAKASTDGRAFWPLSMIQSKAVAGHPFIPTMTTKDKVAMARDVAVINGWDFDRMIPCHGNIIPTHAKEIWLKAFSFLNKK
ncbi:hypothetical protein QFC24_004888 [Naganishia onofrii]|uniref:Uncharacterized protein n=1 Tax=Naganishia onofrii TaxID=1851511 RepID=A0ACC2XBM0_9TREE|nr:hypothetical protein QFC24_004888 [Naganishia onofrii]